MVVARIPKTKKISADTLIFCFHSQRQKLLKKHIDKLLKMPTIQETPTGKWRTMVPRADDHLCTEHTYWTTDGKHWICSCSHCHIGRSWFNRSENEVCQGNGCTVTRPVPPEIFRSAEVVPIHIKFSQNWHCPSCGKINQPACFYCARCRIHHPLRKLPPRRWQCPLATCRRTNTMRGTDIDAAMHHMCRCGFVAY